MAFEIIEVEIASRTVNPADPTEITKMVGKRLIGTANSLEEAKEILQKMEEAEAEADMMASAMCGGECGLMGPQNDSNRFAIEKESGDVYSLQMVQVGEQSPNVYETEYDQELVLDAPLEEQFSEEWRM